jgi:hypothetical protein
VANCFYDKGIPCHDYRLKSHRLTDLKWEWIH